MQERSYFVARMPDEPGSLHKAAAVLKRFNGNIERIQYDQRIDPHTVFFEVLIEPAQFEMAMEELEGMGYLRKKLSEPVYLKFEVSIPHKEGSLFEFLDGITGTNSNIAFLDFDVTGGEPDALKVGIVLDDQCRAEELLDIIKGRYPIRIMEYRTSGEDLDDKVFYVRFAQELRSMIPEVDDDFLLRFLSDINHIMQSLNRMGQDHKAVFQSILDSGRYIRSTSGEMFFCDIQTMDLDDLTIHCIQPPCGGDVYILQRQGRAMMVDTGYGHYHDDIIECMNSIGLAPQDMEAILLTHADADHCGAAGLFPCPTYMSRGSVNVMESNNRAHGSVVESSVLESYYTKMINIFSDIHPPTDVIVFKETSIGRRGEFDVVDRIDLLGLEVEVLNGMGGHVEGQSFFYLPGYHVLFSSDSLIDFRGLTKERKDYMTLAKVLMTSVNVDSPKANAERDALSNLAKAESALVCGGHGPMFRYDATVAPVRTLRNQRTKEF